ncbi:N-acetylglucosamine-6-phosphate deacetylase [Carboxydochorda subterranea]|uniref:N-acetylglucosamine-6-phosphate deacetylase n=1 Tax=Carboxydichorda subterranea TaxID=3109565 RepID=A0ABZ1BZB1_9FIRM|nr:N-acetylglucosamine-6-phosphate deacetylase [Limnochorda sp. L945t]WRP18029.1 N-acetylglucosamine-6-phosphate deacetylase [Limnochorda sp. L945t]
MAQRERAPERTTVIEGGTLIHPLRPAVPDGAVVIRGDTIVYAGPMAELDAAVPPDATRVDASGGYVVPGWVDVHVHGGGGADTMDASPEGLRRMTLAHAAAGTTALLCTTVTASLEQTVEAERAVAEAYRMQRRWWKQAPGSQVTGPGDPEAWGARIAGIHLEGPYLNPERKGAQNPAYMRDPDLAELQRMLDASKAADGEVLLRLVTMAPERAGSEAAIRWLAAHGVQVAVGHSAAEGEVLERAIEAGAGQVTHLFNGMAPFHHRTPGLAGAALADERLVAQLIADGVHVHPVALKVAYRARGARGIALITDALAPMGLGEGRFRLGDFEVVVKDGACRLPDGTLAGSILGLGQAVQHMVRWAGATLADAVAMASWTPALSVGLGGELGSLRPGARGDVAVLDAGSLEVRTTIVAGHVVYQREVARASP